MVQNSPYVKSHIHCLKWEFEYLHEEYSLLCNQKGRKDPVTLEGWPVRFLGSAQALVPLSLILGDIPFEIIINCSLSQIYVVIDSLAFSH